MSHVYNRVDEALAIQREPGGPRDPVELRISPPPISYSTAVPVAAALATKGVL